MHATTCGADPNLTLAARRLSPHQSWPLEQRVNMPSMLPLA
jgi:hypothetical protein